MSALDIAYALSAGCLQGVYIMTQDKEAIEALDNIAPKALAHAGSFEHPERYHTTKQDIQIIRQALEAQQRVEVDLEGLECEILESLKGNQPLTAIGGITAALNYLNQKGYLASIGAVQGWQDIETAPRDGTQFLVTDGECTVMAEWANEIIDVWDSTCHMVFAHKPSETITHWMPLPAPPVQEKEKE